MAQDIRELLKTPDQDAPKLPKDHLASFESKLDTHFAEQPKEQFNYWKIAAIVLVLIGVGYATYSTFNPTAQPKMAQEETGPVTDQSEENTIRLGDISPDLKKLEDYYSSSIKVSLASIEITPENQELIDGYMERLAELDKEYSALNQELNKIGPNEATVTALVDNLKLRLELLFKLKNKLKELKNQNNEAISTNAA
ncbi:MAG: hypothetical protein ABJM06_04320 [Gilvibacter sp.]